MVPQDLGTEATQPGVQTCGEDFLGAAAYSLNTHRDKINQTATAIFLADLFTASSPESERQSTIF
jgi:hypothetical protein